MDEGDGSARMQLPRAARLFLILVAITTVLSLLYGAQYYAGGPLRLPVVSQFYDLELSSSKKLVAAGAEDGIVRVWEVPSQLPKAVAKDYNTAKEPPWTVHELLGHAAPVIDVAFSADSSRLTSVDTDAVVRLWDVASYQTVQELPLQGGPLLDSDLSADRSVLAALGQDGTVRVWDLTSREQIQSFEPSGNARMAVAINAPGTLVAAGDGPSILVWDVKTGQVAHRLEGYLEDPAKPETWVGHKKEVTALAFDPASKLLASGAADATLLYWDLETGKVSDASEGHWAAVSALIFDAKGSLVMSGSRDNKARTFRLPGGKSTALYEGHKSSVSGVSFGPTSETLLTASQDGTVRVWETANQYTVHLEWSRKGFQPGWGKILAVWMVVSGLLGLLCVYGLWRARSWGHLLTLALYLLGPIVVLGPPVLEVLSYPMLWSTKLQLAWPLLLLLFWYVVLLVVATREPVQLFYEAPRSATLAQKLVAVQRTTKTRFGLYAGAVWFALLVILYSVLRRFNLDIAFMGHWLKFIMAGSLLTLGLSAASIALAVVLALLGALGRLSKNPIANGLSGFYISLIRGTPLLVQIYIWYLGLPRLDIVLQAVPAGILALGVNYGAYMTEIFRAGIQAIGKGQHEAAAALGMSRGQTLRRIVLPQAFRIVIPPIGNEFIAMMKDSSLVSVMAVWELTYRAQKIGRQNFRNMETFIIAAAFYWALTMVFQFFQGKLEEYMARGERR